MGLDLPVKLYGGDFVFFLLWHLLVKSVDIRTGEETVLHGSQRIWPDSFQDILWMHRGSGIG